MIVTQPSHQSICEFWKQCENCKKKMWLLTTTWIIKKCEFDENVNLTKIFWRWTKITNFFQILPEFEKNGEFRPLFSPPSSSANSCKILNLEDSVFIKAYRIMWWGMRWLQSLNSSKEIVISSFKIILFSLSLWFPCTCFPSFPMFKPVSFML